MDDALHKARELLGDVTPLAFDCGKRCGAACCQGAEEDGMLLFPGEERYYDSCSFAKILPDKLGCRLVCSGTCERSLRPLACRIFPLVIRVAGQEEAPARANITMDVRAWPVCMLMKSGMKGLKTEFVQAVRMAAALLIAEDKHLAFLIRLNDQLAAYEQMRRSFLSGREL